MESLTSKSKAGSELVILARDTRQQVENSLLHFKYTNKYQPYGTLYHLTLSPCHHNLHCSQHRYLTQNFHHTISTPTKFSFPILHSCYTYQGLSEPTTTTLEVEFNRYPYRNSPLLRCTFQSIQNIQSLLRSPCARVMWAYHQVF